MNRHIAKLIALIVFWSVSTGSAKIQAQNLGADFTNAANVWQAVPVNLSTQIDNVTPSVRAQRSAYWEPILSANEDFAIEADEDPTLQPELVSVQGNAWAWVTFTSFHVFVTDAAFHHIYTEMNFTVNQVIRQASGTTLSAGQVIDVALPNGRATNGTKTGSCNLVPEEYFWKPNHQYLVQLSFNSNGGFFTPWKRWDVSSGNVQEDELIEVLRASHGTAVMNGMATADAIRYLDQVLP
jgi:hypothetical protein